MANNLVSGLLEISDKGQGFLRDPEKNFQPSRDDVFVSNRLIKEYNLKDGHCVTGSVGKSSKSNQAKPLKEIVEVNDMPLDEFLKVVSYKSVTVIDPEEPLQMRMGKKDITGIMIDLFTPIGKGQRGMVISPPKAGKTTILKHIAKAILKNHPDIKVFVLLVDERPEEVTDFKRDLPGAMVLHSSSDQDVEQHLRITGLAMNMAIRIAESGQDAVVLVDSLTRMGRAFNKDADSGGKTLSGGLAANALEIPRRFFGAARNIEGGGSLTIIATILVDTGSRMDEVIFQEFKGTGNMDLVLSRECAERRLFPAINIRESGTRKEHKLLAPERLEYVNQLRRKTAGMKAPEALEYVLDELRSNIDRLP